MSATKVDTATSTTHAVVNKSNTLQDPSARPNGTPIPSNGHAKSSTPSTSAPKSKYRHVAVVHSRPRTSCLSHDSTTAPSFLGFRNLMVVVLIASNLRLMIENFMKYGVLICLSCHDYRQKDLVLGAILFLLIPCHLFGAYLIELAAAEQAKSAIGRRKRSDASDASARDKAIATQKARSPWPLIGMAHAANVTLCLGVTSSVVYWQIHHPLIGTACELHAIIVWLKTCSYAFTNRDLRQTMLFPDATSSLPDIYSSCPYPRNITVKNLSYFWWAPTLVYQPVYPRSDRIRWGFVLKRLGEFAVLSMFIWIASAQYAAPVLVNSLETIQTLNIVSILERLMKLSTISLVIWLAGFFALFQSLLNALAEIMRFGDREFYTDWWNSPSVGSYWRTWNKPVNHFMRRHIYAPLIGRGWSHQMSSIIVFLLSAVLHELLVGVPTHNIIGVAFAGMMVQIPLILLTLPLEKRQGANSKIAGNVVFWVTFCLVGQPFAALMYFFAWQAKYGSVSRMSVKR